MQIELNKLKCSKCGHEWVPRVSPVVMCPACKSRRYNEKKEPVNAE